MNRTAIAIIVSAILIAVLLGGTYGLFVLLMEQFPPGRPRGMLSASLMIGSGLACAGIGYLASKWVQRGE